MNVNDVYNLVKALTKKEYRKLYTLIKNVINTIPKTRKNYHSLLMNVPLY